MTDINLRIKFAIKLRFDHTMTIYQTLTPVLEPGIQFLMFIQVMMIFYFNEISINLITS